VPLAHSRRRRSRRIAEIDDVFEGDRHAMKRSAVVTRRGLLIEGGHRDAVGRGIDRFDLAGGVE